MLVFDIWELLKTPSSLWDAGMTKFEGFEKLPFNACFSWLAISI